VAVQLIPMELELPVRFKLRIVECRTLCRTSASSPQPEPRPATSLIVFAQSCRATVLRIVACRPLLIVTGDYSSTAPY
jgi:hypothetical protein